MKTQVYIPRKVFQKIMHWVLKAPGEIGGMGTVAYNKEHNYFYVHDVFLVKQEVGAAHTDLDEVSLGQLEYKVFNEKLPGELNYWWHSHADMKVFWSGQDEQTIKELGSKGYVIASVFNKSYEMRSAACVSVASKFTSDIIYTDNIPTFIYDAVLTEAEKEALDSQYDELVHTRKIIPLDKYVPQPFNNRGGGQRRSPFKQSKWIMNLTPEIMETKLRSWQEYFPTIADVEKDRIVLVMAAITRLHPSVFENTCYEMDQKQWIVIDDLAEKFLKENPDFPWNPPDITATKTLLINGGQNANH